jgi:RNA polymerase sigma factor (sigma-70 family)
MSSEPRAQTVRVDTAAVVKELRPALYAFFLRRTAHPAEAEDLTQEVIIRVLTQSGISSNEHLKGYCFRAAANLWADRGRRRLARGSTMAWNDAASYAGDEGLSPERVVAGREEMTRVIRALNELPERTRQVFVLQRLEQMTYPQIAESLGIAVSTVEKHMIKALAYLNSKRRGQGES